MSGMENTMVICCFSVSDWDGGGRGVISECKRPTGVSEVWLLTQEGAGDELRHLVPRPAHLRQVRQLPVQHPLELRHKRKTQRHNTHTLVVRDLCFSTLLWIYVILKIN